MAKALLARPLCEVLFAAFAAVALATPRAAGAIACGETVGGDLSGGESHQHSFTAAAGDRVLLSWGADHTPTELIIELSAPGGLAVALQPLPHPGSVRPVSYVSAPLPSAGSYTIRLTSADTFPLDDPDQYVLTLESVTGSFAGQSNWLPSPVCGVPGGTRVIRCGERFPAQGYPYPSYPALVSPGSSDTFTFHAIAGDAVRVKIGGWTTQHRVFLFDPTGELVFFTTGLYCTGNAACSSPPLPLTGVYTLAVAAHSQDSEGDYQLTLESVSGSFNGGSNAPGFGFPAPVCGLAPDGARALCSEPGRAGTGLVSGSIAGYGDSDAFTFHAQAGDTLSGSVSSAAPGLTAQLFSPDGALVPGPLLPSAGVYTLVVNRADVASTCGSPCAYFASYTLTYQGTACTNACRDGTDNDGDGLIDANDDGCTSVDDLSEASDCSDEVDNDEDGLVDVEDPGCGESATWYSGWRESPPCDNGADDDGDGLVDFGGSGPTTDDPQCGGQGSWIAENVQACGLGPELTLALAALLGVRAWRQRRSASA